MRLSTIWRFPVVVACFYIAFFELPSNVGAWNAEQIVDSDEHTTIVAVLKGLSATFSLGDDIVRYYALGYGGCLYPLSLDHPDTAWTFIFSDKSVLAHTTESCTDWVYGYFPSDLSQKMTLNEPSFYPTIIEFNNRYYDPFSPEKEPFRFFFYSREFGTWQILSRGPDGDFDIHCEDLNIENTPPQPFLKDINKIYDPTNGLISNGDIYPAVLDDYYSTTTTYFTLWMKKWDEGMDHKEWRRWIKEEEKKKSAEKK